MFPKAYKFKSLAARQRRSRLYNHLHFAEFSDNIDEFIDKIKGISKRDLRKIESRTVAQAKCTDWFYYRKNLITSTLTIRVVRAIERGAVDYYINESIRKRNDYTLYYPPIVYGRKFEKTGLLAFVKKFKKCHDNVTVSNHGLKIEEETRILAGSIDLMINCSCCGTFIVELKCSWKLRDSLIPDWTSLDYITSDGELNKKHQYMYQIQTYLGIYKIKRGLFVVWTPQDILIIEIPFDEVLYDRIKKCSETYYFKYYMPIEYPELYENLDSEMPLLL